MHTSFFPLRSQQKKPTPFCRLQCFFFGEGKADKTIRGRNNSRRASKISPQSSGHHSPHSSLPFPGHKQAPTHRKEGTRIGGEKSLKANWTLPKAKRKEESSGIVLFHGYASPHTYPPPLFFLVTVSDIFLFLFFEVALAPPPNTTLLLCMGWAWVLKR